MVLSFIRKLARVCIRKVTKWNPDRKAVSCVSPCFLLQDPQFGPAFISTFVSLDNGYNFFNSLLLASILSQQQKNQTRIGSYHDNCLVL